MPNECLNSEKNTGSFRAQEFTHHFRNMADYDRVHTVYQMLTPKPQVSIHDIRKLISRNSYVATDATLGLHLIIHHL